MSLSTSKQACRSSEQAAALRSLGEDARCAKKTSAAEPSAAASRSGCLGPGMPAHIQRDTSGSWCVDLHMLWPAVLKRPGSISQFGGHMMMCMMHGPAEHAGASSTSCPADRGGCIESPCIPKASNHCSYGGLLIPARQDRTWGCSGCWLAHHAQASCTAGAGRTRQLPQLRARAPWGTHSQPARHAC